MAVKARLLRLAMDQDEALAVLARIDGVSVTAEIREAIDQWILRRPADPGFQAQLGESIERNLELLEQLRLAGGEVAATQ